MPSFSLAERLANGVARARPQRTIDISLERPIVSFSFDDVPETALAGAAILEAHGARGTFYAAGGLAGQRQDGQMIMGAEHYRQLARRGHEIGHHTFSHRRPGDLGSAYARDLETNDAFLAGVSRRVRNFAFPFGLSAPHAQREVRRFRSARSAQVGINNGAADLDYLRAVDIRGDSTDKEMLAWIDAAVMAKGWLIFLTHDVQDKPTDFGAQPRLLDRMVRHAIEAGAEILTVDAALDRAGAPQ